MRRVNRIQNETRKERERIEQEFEKRQMEDLQNFEKLVMRSRRWHKSVVLRKFITELEAKDVSSSLISVDRKKWLEWAHKKADWYDPFIEADDELLSEVDRDTLNFK